MNVFLKMAAAISGRLGPESNSVALVAQVAKQACRFQDRVDNKAIANGGDAICGEIRDTINRAMCRLSVSDRESLVYWVLQEVAARNAVEKMAAQSPDR